MLAAKIPELRKYILLSLFCLWVQTEINAQDTLKVKQFIVPAALVVYGISSYLKFGLPTSYEVNNFRNKYFSDFHTKVDDALVFVPAVLTYGMGWTGVKCKSDITTRTVIFAKAAVISLVAVNIIKYSTNVLRPDSSAHNSFPSGHTAFAFAMASVMQHELADASIWWSVLGYGIASSTGALRILNNKHWFSDVLVGAGIGIASGHIASKTHKYKWKSKLFENAMIVPGIQTNFYGLCFNKRF